MIRKSKSIAMPLKELATKIEAITVNKSPLLLANLLKMKHPDDHRWAYADLHTLF